MTIAVTVRVTDGIVLASDSATTFSDDQGRVVKVYNNANKIFNLVKVWPIGALTYGAGSIGVDSIATLSKDLRRRLDPRTGLDAAYAIDPRNFTIEEVAIRARRFLFEERYRQAYPNGSQNYFLGYRICGYSAQGTLPEAWEVAIVGNDCNAPSSLYDADNFGVRWAGEHEAIDRLLFGLGTRAEEVLEAAGQPPQEAKQTATNLRQRLYAQLMLPAMPIQDAIDLAYFLADTAAKFAQFSLRAATVGGAIDVATITKHEGFKWVIRKHYYDEKFNREHGNGP